MLLRVEFERTILNDEAGAEKWEELAEQDFEPRRLTVRGRETMDRYDHDDVLKAGLRAYAHKQAYYRRERARRTKELWAKQEPAVNKFFAWCKPDGMRISN